MLDIYYAVQADLALISAQKKHGAFFFESALENSGLKIRVNPAKIESPYSKVESLVLDIKKGLKRDVISNQESLLKEITKGDALGVITKPNGELLKKAEEKGLKTMYIRDIPLVYNPKKIVKLKEKEAAIGEYIRRVESKKRGSITKGLMLDYIQIFSLLGFQPEDALAIVYRMYETRLSRSGENATPENFAKFIVAHNGEKEEPLCENDLCKKYRKIGKPQKKGNMPKNTVHVAVSSSSKQTEKKLIPSTGKPTFSCSVELSKISSKSSTEANDKGCKKKHKRMEKERNLAAEKGTQNKVEKQEIDYGIAFL